MDVHFCWVLGKEEMHSTGLQLTRPPTTFYLSDEEPILRKVSLGSENKFGWGEGGGFVILFYLLFVFKNPHYNFSNLNYLFTILNNTMSQRNLILPFSH